MDVNYMHPEINDFRGLLVFDPEPKDMYQCHPYHVLEIYKPPVNEPMGSYQIQHLNLGMSNDFMAVCNGHEHSQKHLIILLSGQ